MRIKYPIIYLTLTSSTLNNVFIKAISSPKCWAYMIYRYNSHPQNSQLWSRSIPAPAVWQSRGPRTLQASRSSSLAPLQYFSWILEHTVTNLTSSYNILSFQLILNLFINTLFKDSFSVNCSSLVGWVAHSYHILSGIALEVAVAGEMVLVGAGSGLSWIYNLQYIFYLQLRMRSCNLMGHF